MHRVAMLECAAWRSLTRAARLVLDRLEIENARHHGKLIVTYDQFLAHIGRKRRHPVAAAIEQLERLGFLEVVEHGKWNAGRGLARVTLPAHIPTSRYKPPTDEWRSPVTRTSLRDGDENVTTDFEIGDENVTTSTFHKERF
jgi:hypothetical protein